MLDMPSGDIESRKVEEIGLLDNEKLNHKSAVEIIEEFPFLTREDLIKLEIKEPYWRRVRIGLLIAFWIIWLGLLTAAVIIVIFSPKCPPTPTLEFWQQKVGYWLDPFAFKDSDGDLVGDFKGIMEKIRYITDDIGAGFIILDSFLSGTFTNTKQKIGLMNSFTEVDSALGTLDDFRSLLSLCRRTGVDVVISLDFNAVSLSHPWAKNESYLTAASVQTKSRAGETSDVTINGETFYSVGDKDMVDLNIENPDLIDQVKKVVDFWLSEGVNGILLKNAAFYVEKDVGGSNSIFVQNATNAWFESYPTSQIFVNDSLHLVQVVREVVDGYHRSGTRQKVLIVDAGDTGYGLRDADDALMFLGTEDKPGAHIIVSREFVRDRGWKTLPITESWLHSSISSYDISTNQNKSSLLLATATTSDRIHSDAVSFALTFLLQGTPVVYYGAELNTAYAGRMVSPKNVYPKGKVPFPNLDNQDSVLSSHLPMPWDRSGKGFSPAGEKANFTNFLINFEIKETVQSALSAGREITLFKLMQKLIKLRQSPSLLWGQFRRVYEKDGSGYEVFLREAEGFPSFVIVLVRDPYINGRVYDFTNTCPQLRNHIVFPPKSTLPQNVALRSDRIYVDAVNGQPSVYVFECM